MFIFSKKTSFNVVLFKEKFSKGFRNPFDTNETLSNDSFVSNSINSINLT
jgi:hypothetical protein